MIKKILLSKLDLHLKGFLSNCATQTYRALKKPQFIYEAVFISELQNVYWNLSHIKSGTNACIPDIPAILLRCGTKVVQNFLFKSTTDFIIGHVKTYETFIHENNLTRDGGSIESRCEGRSLQPLGALKSKIWIRANELPRVHIYFQFEVALILVTHKPYFILLIGLDLSCSACIHFAPVWRLYGFTSR